MLQRAIENEVEEFVAAHASSRTNEDARRWCATVLPARQILTGLGALRSGSRESAISAPRRESLLIAAFFRGICGGCPASTP
jgi:hypothetical protein